MPAVRQSDLRLFSPDASKMESDEAAPEAACNVVAE